MPLQSTPEWLRANAAAAPIGVDREAKVIRGYIVAQLGPFKTPGRGEFNQASLERIVSLYAQKPAGIKARFAHPGLSADGIGKLLGRSKGARLDGNSVRADLHLDPSSFSTPSGDLGTYVMDLAENDPAAFGSSLVLQTEKTYVLDDKGKRKTNDKGEDLPPLWMPTKLHASDVVDEGDAVHDGFLAHGIDADGLPDEALWHGSQILDSLFAGQSREIVDARLQAFLAKYLDRRYGERPRLSVDTARRRLRLQEIAAGD